jgi:hypothetical protein
MKSGPSRHLGSKNLILFRVGEHDYKLPQLEENDQDSEETLEANLSPEERSFVSHYLRYADTLLKQSGEQGVHFYERRHNTVVEMGRGYGLSAQNGEDEDNDGAQCNAA